MTHTQLSECSVRAPIRKGREGKGRGREASKTLSLGVSGTTRIRSNGDLRAFGFGSEAIR